MSDSSRSPDSAMMNRDQSVDRLKNQQEPWDLFIVGGGATGVAIALDAASRGLRVALAERDDFGKGTSSRSTKLVHGGVRYLRQGNITLVKDALRERELLKKNAPALVGNLPFIIPCQGRVEQLYYAVGLKAYDWLAGKGTFNRSRRLSASETLDKLPTIKTSAYANSVVYEDGQFDDAKLLIAMAKTAAKFDACLSNYMSVVGFEKNSSGQLLAANVVDHETGRELRVTAKCFVNATGPFCDEVRRLDQPDTAPLLKVSQGVHIVLPARFFPGSSALIIPKTADGRVLFIIPWHGYVLVGTTDTEIDAPTAEPLAKPDEIEFLLNTAGQYLVEQPNSHDVLSVFTGIRPLVKGDPSARTASLSRDHTIRVSDSNLITITGGKWTTVRKMAEDCVDRAYGLLEMPLQGCRTKDLRFATITNVAGVASDSDRILASEAELSREQVISMVRHEMARTVEDVLARRNRMLFCDARRAIASSEQVADWMAEELERDDSWKREQVKAFQDLARHYLL